jgi:crotonobetainyl-CoA:carnitine CoA-transferase CaiB-like acyl-CoA transferase
MLSYQATYFLHSGQVPGRQGSGHDSIATYRSFLASDGVRVVVTANTEKMWAKLVTVLGRKELADDPRFLNNQDRFDNRDALWPELEKAFLARPAAEWMKLLIEAGVPAGVINTLDTALLNEHATARDMVLQLESDDGRATPATIRVAGNPIKFVGDAPRTHRFPPALNVDHDEVLADWLGAKKD